MKHNVAIEMVKVSKMTGRGNASQEGPQQSKGSLITMFANRRTLRKMRVMDPGEERYVRPPRQYDLPAYRQGHAALHLEREVPAADAVV